MQTLKVITGLLCLIIANPFILAIIAKDLNLNLTVLSGMICFVVIVSIGIGLIVSVTENDKPEAQ